MKIQSFPDKNNLSKYLKRWQILKICTSYNRKSKIKVFLKQTDKTCYNFNNEICSRNPQTDSKTLFYMKVATPIGGKVHHLNLSNKDLFFMLQS